MMKTRLSAHAAEPTDSTQQARNAEIDRMGYTEGGENGRRSRRIGGIGKK
jgi:hypothetical protein